MFLGEKMLKTLKFRKWVFYRRPKAKLNNIREKFGVFNFHLIPTSMQKQEHNAVFLLSSF